MSSASSSSPPEPAPDGAGAGEVLVRRAVVEDAVAGAWCHLLCWREAYSGLMDPGVLAERTGSAPADLARRTALWAEGIDDGWIRWLAMNPMPEVPVEDRVIGFSAAGPARDEDVPVELELYAIYTRRAWWGSGLGDRLLDVAVGKQPAAVWVLGGNERAIGFYRRHGFRPDGATKPDPPSGLTELRMVRP